jgi:mRNA interferase RelE/StbE
MHKVVLVRSATRAIKKLDNHIQTKIVESIEDIARNPYNGELLHGTLSAVYSWHLRIKGVEYRIAYQIIDAEVIVLILKIGNRENFYKELLNQLL